MELVESFTVTQAIWIEFSKLIGIHLKVKIALDLDRS
jgi:hypothetical protein